MNRTISSPSSLFRKTVALAVAQCFLFSFVLSPALSALAQERRDGAAAAEDGFLLPPGTGRITGGKYFGSDSVVIAVQDLHCHPEVQKNIHRILSLFDERYGLPRVYLEGASGRVDLSWLDFAQGPDVRERVTGSLVDGGMLTGAEHYAALRGRPDQLYGLEDRALHAANLKRLGTILGEQDRIEPLLSLLESELAPLERAYFSAAHRDFRRLVERHRGGRVDGRKFYRLLKKYADTLGLDIYGYRSIAAFIELSDLEKGLDYPRAASELQRFVGRVRRDLPYGVYASLLEKTNHFSRLDEAYLLLSELDRRCGFSADGSFPALARFFRYLDASRKVNPLRLVREENLLCREIGYRLSRSGAEREVAFLVDFFRYLGDYCRNRISADDLEYFAANEPAFRTAWMKYTGNRKFSVLDAFRPELDAYYRANLDRNLCFLRALEDGGVRGSAAAGAPGDPEKVLEALPRAREIVAVVTGGFHTEGLARLLEQKRISYLVITPNVTQGTGFSEKVYTGLIRQQSVLLSQSLPPVDLSQAPLMLKVRCAAQALFPLAAGKDVPDPEICRRMTGALERLVRKEGGAGPVAFRIAGRNGDGSCECVVTVGDSAQRFNAVPGGIAVPAFEKERSREVLRLFYSGLSLAALKLEWAFPAGKARYALPFTLRSARTGESRFWKAVDGPLSLILAGCATGAVLSGFWPAALLSLGAYAAARVCACSVIFNGEAAAAGIDAAFDDQEGPPVQAFGTKVREVMREVRRMNPLLAQLLVRPSLECAAVLWHQNGTIMSWSQAEKRYGAVFTLLKPHVLTALREAGVVPADERLRVRFVTLTDETMVGKDACILASLGLERQVLDGQTIHTAIFSGHTALWEYLATDEPPDGFALDEWLRLLARHEASEYAALSPVLSSDPAVIGKNPWLADFNAYLSGQGLPRDAASFHRFLSENRAPQLAGQAMLLAGIEVIARPPRVIYAPEHSRIFGRKELEGYRSLVIREFRLNGSGNLLLAGRKWARFEGRGDQEAEVYLEEGLVTKVVFAADGTVEEFARIVDNATGKVTDTFRERLPADKLKDFKDVTIRNFKLTDQGTLEFGGRAWARFDDRPGEKVDVLIKDGIVTKVVFRKDGAAKDLVLVRDNATGALIDAFMGRISARRMKELDNVTVANLALSADGVLELAGRIWAQFSGRAGEKVDVVIRNGLVEKVFFVSDGTEATLLRYVDNATGDTLDTSGALSSGRLRDLRDATINNIVLNKDGNLRLFGRTWELPVPRPDEKVDVRVEDGVIRSLRFADGTELPFYLAADPATGKIIDSVAVLTRVRRKLLSPLIRYRLDADGALNIDGRTIARFDRYPGAEVEMDLHWGRLRKVRVLKDGAVIAEQELASARTGKEKAASPPEKKAPPKVVTETRLTVARNGMLVYNGTALACFKDLPGSEVRVTAEDGIPRSLVFIGDRDGKPVLDRDGIPLSIDLTDDVDGQMAHNRFDAARQRLAELEQLSADAGEAYRGGEYEEAARLFGALIEKVKAGTDKDGREGHLAARAEYYLNNCRTFVQRDSAPARSGTVDLADANRMSAREFAGFDNVTIRGMRVARRGFISIAGRRWAKYTDREFEPAELEVRQGCVVKVSFADGESRELPTITDNASGRIVDTFADELNAKRMAFLSDATLSGVRLTDRHGVLKLGGKHWGTFPSHAGETVDVIVEDGVVSGVRFNDGSEAAFTVIRDNRTGRVLDSFSGALTAKKLASLDGVTLEGAAFDAKGRLFVGGRSWTRFEDHAKEKVSVTVEKGIVTSLTLADGERRDFSLIYDENGALVDSYYRLLGPLPPGLDAVVRREHLDSGGFLKVGSGFVCYLAHYPSAEIEMRIEKGRITAITLVRDREGRPVLDADGELLELDLRRDVRKQMAANSLDSRRRAFAGARERYLAGVAFFAQGKYVEARRALASAVSRSAGRKAAFERVAALDDKALFYLGLLRDTGKKETFPEKEAASLIAAESCLNDGDIRKAMRHFNAIRKKALAGSILETAAAQRSAHCETLLRCGDAEQLFQEGKYRGALLRFTNILKAGDRDRAVRELAERRVAECRAYLKYAIAQDQYRRRDYAAALKNLAGALKTSVFNSESYQAAKALMDECRHQISLIDDEARSLDVMRRYAASSALDAEKQDELFERIAADPESAAAQEARRELAGGSMGVVMKVAEKIANPDSDYYNDLLDEGFLCAYGAVDTFAGQAKGSRGSFRHFLVQELTEHFTEMRKGRNRSLYGEVSLSKPVSGLDRDGDKTTIGEFLPSAGRTPEEAFLDNEELRRVVDILPQFARQRDRQMIWRVVAEGESAEEVAEEFGIGADAVREVLKKALVLLQSPPSLGENLRALAAAAVSSLKAREPASLLLAELARYSKDLGRQLIELYRAGKNVTERYPGYVSILREEEAIDGVEVWESAYLQDRDAWSYATVERLAGGGLKLLVNSAFFDALHALGDPEKEQAILSLLVRHEADEDVALSPSRRDGTALALRPWLKDFDDYLIRNGLARDPASFHGFILELARRAPLTAAEKALKDQAALLAFARAIPRGGSREGPGRREEKPAPGDGDRQLRIYDNATGALVQVTDRLRGDGLAKLKDNTIRNFRTASSGEVKIGGKYICALTNHPNAELELLVRDGVVTALRVMRDGKAVEEKKLILISDAAGGTVIDSCDNLSRRKLAELENNVVEGIATTGTGQLYVGGEYIGMFGEFPDTPVELRIENGVVAALRIVRDGHEVYRKTLALAVDNATGKPVFSFINMPKAKAKRLQDHTIRGLTSAADGKIYFAGEQAGRFSNHPDAEAELTVEQGVVTALRIVKDGKTVQEKRLSVVYDNRTGKLVDAFEHLGGAQMKKLTDHTIKRIFTSSNGDLELGGRKVAGLSAHPNAEAEVTVKNGVVMDVRVAGGEAGAGKDAKTLAQVYDDRTGELQSSFERLSGDRLAELEDHTIRNLATDELGNVRVGARNVCVFTGYPSSPVELKVRQGVVTEARVFRNGAVAVEKKFALICDNRTGRLADSFADALSAERMSGLSHHTIRNFFTDSMGCVSVGGRQVCRLMQHPNTEAEIDVEQGVATGVRALRDGKTVEEKQFSLIYDDNGRLAGSFDRNFSGLKLEGLARNRITRFYTDASGRISIGGADVCRLTKYPDTEVELSVEQGVVTGVKVIQDGGIAEDRQLSLVYDADGKLAGSFDVMNGDQLRALSRHTIKRYFANAAGAVNIGGAYLASLPGYPNAELELDVEQGVVTALRVMREGKAVLEKKLCLVYDRETGALVDSFGEVLAPEKLKTLTHHTIKRFITSGQTGAVYLGGHYFCRFRGYPGAEAELDIEQGVVTAVRVLRDGAVAQEKKLALVQDNATGKLVDAFDEAYPRERLALLADHTIRNFRTSGIGLVHVGNEYVCMLSDYPHAEVDLTVREGKVTAVTLVKDRNGHRPLDVHGGPLVIDPARNVKDQIERSSLDAQLRRRQELQEQFNEAQKLFLAQEWVGASKMLARILARVGSLSSVNMKDAGIARQARQYMKICKPYLKEQRYDEQKEIPKYGAAEALFAAGDYAAAQNAFAALARRVPENSALYLAARDRIRDCKAKQRFAEAEALYEDERYAEASRKYRAVLRNAEDDRELYRYAERQAQNCRLNLLYLGAEELFDRGRYEDALKKYRAVRKGAEAGSEIAVSSRNGEKACREKLDVLRNSVPRTMRSYYTQRPAEDAGSILARVRLLRASGDADAAQNACIALAENQVWLVKEVAGRFTSEMYDYYDELVSEGFLETLDAAEDYLAAPEDGLAPFEDYLRDRLSRRFAALRTIKNRHLYKEKSLETPVGRQSGKGSDTDGRTLEHVIPKGGLSVEEEFIMREEQERIRRLLERVMDPAAVTMVMQVIGDGMTAEEVAGATGRSVEDVKAVLAGALELMQEDPAPEFDAIERAPEQGRAVRYGERGGSSLGENLETAVGRARRALERAGAPGALVKALADASLEAGTRVSMLYRYGRNVTAQYRVSAQTLLRCSGADRVEVRDADHLLYKDAWSLARLEAGPDGKTVLYVHKVFLDALENRGPPADFEPQLDRAAARDKFLLLLVAHESAEYMALYGPGTTLYRDFGAWLGTHFPGTETAAARTSGNFHRYIEYLAALTPEELAAYSPLSAALPAQKILLDFARRTVELHALSAKLSTPFMLYLFCPGTAAPGREQDIPFGRDLLEKVRGEAPDADLEMLLAVSGERPAAALDGPLARLSRRNGARVSTVLENTFIAGAAPGDVPLLNRVAEAGGMAVYAGEPVPGLSPRVFVLPVKGAAGIERLLESHLDFLEDKRADRTVRRVAELLESARKPLFDALEKEFADEIAFKGDFRICSEASYITARLLGRSLGLPVGGSAPDRIELITGAVLRPGSLRPETHRWIAVCENGVRIVLVDVTYAQFDKAFTRRFLVGGYDKTVRAYRYMEWGEVSAYYLKVLGARDEVLAKLVRLTREVKRIKEGDFAEEDFYNAGMRERLDRVVDELSPRFPPAGPLPAASPAAKAVRAGANAFKGPGSAVVPARLARDLADTAARAVESDGRAWVREHCPELSGKNFTGVYPALTRADIAKLMHLSSMGIPAMAITPGKPANARLVCHLPLSVPWMERPLDLRVWEQRFERGEGTVTLLYLDHPLLSPGSAGGEAAFVFGRGALSLLERLSADPVVAATVTGGVERFSPGMIELKGEQAAFAFPSLVNDRYRTSLSGAVFAFNCAAEGRGSLRLSQDEAKLLDADPELIGNAAEDGMVDFSRLGLGAAEIALADEEVMKYYPWLTDAVPLPRVDSAEKREESLKRELRAFGDSFRSRGTDAVMRRKANFASRTTVQQLRAAPDIHDRGRGTLTDLENYLDELKENWVSIVQLHSLLRDGNPFAFETGIIDWLKVPEVSGDASLAALAALPRGAAERIDRERVEAADRELASRAFARLRAEKGARLAQFEGFARANREHFAGMSEEEQYAQFVAYTQAHETLAAARRKEMKVFTEYALRSASELEAAGWAALQWVRFGFDGVRLDLSALGEVSAGALTALKNEMMFRSPDAVLSVVLPTNIPAAVRSTLQNAGVTVVDRCLPGERPQRTAPGSWLEIALPRDEVLVAGSPSQVKQWFREVLGSGTQFVCLPDALKWGGRVHEGIDFRNPSCGDRCFDVSDELVEMVKTRAGMVRKNALWGMEYERGYDAAFAAVTSAKGKFDPAAFMEERKIAFGGHEFSGPGLAAFVRVWRYLQTEEKAAKEVLPVSDAGVLFSGILETLSRTPGLKADEWGTGWQYVRSLQRKYLASRDASRRAGYALQLLDFANGLSDALLEREYFKERFGNGDRPLVSEGDRELLRNLLFAASAEGIVPGSIAGGFGRGPVPLEVTARLREMAAQGTPGSPSWLTLDGRATDEKALATRRAELFAPGAASPFLRRVAAALYLRSYLDYWGNRMSKTGVQVEVRAVLKTFADSAPVTDGSADPSDAAYSRWALSELLKSFDLLTERELPGLDVEKAYEGALDTLGIERVLGAA